MNDCGRIGGDGDLSAHGLEVSCDNRSLCDSVNM